MARTKQELIGFLIYVLLQDVVNGRLGSGDNILVEEVMKEIREVHDQVALYRVGSHGER